MTPHQSTVTPMLWSTLIVAAGPTLAWTLALLAGARTVEWILDHWHPDDHDTPDS